jgi:hypothetical protein
MRGDSLPLRKKKPAWSECPSCFEDVAVQRVGRKPFYIDCPHCGTSLSFVWWQRLLMVTLGVGLAFGIPAACGMRGFTLLLVGTLLLFPGFVQGIVIYCRIFPSKYVKKRGPVTTLFER